MIKKEKGMDWRDKGLELEQSQIQADKDNFGGI